MLRPECCFVAETEAFTGASCRRPELDRGVRSANVGVGVVRGGKLTWGSSLQTNTRRVLGSVLGGRHGRLVWIKARLLEEAALSLLDSRFWPR